jgi:hypothetical protein
MAREARQSASSRQRLAVPTRGHPRVRSADVSGTRVCNFAVAGIWPAQRWGAVRARHRYRANVALDWAAYVRSWLDNGCWRRRGSAGDRQSPSSRADQVARAISCEPLEDTAPARSAGHASRWTQVCVVVVDERWVSSRIATSTPSPRRSRSEVRGRSMRQGGADPGARAQLTRQLSAAS